MPILGIIASSITGNLVTNSYESIATTTVGAGGSSTITFSSIPSTYKHLQLRYLCRSNRSGSSQDFVKVQFNSDTATNYSYHSLSGDGTAASAGDGANSDTLAQFYMAGATTAASTFAGGVIDVLEYKNTNIYKTVRILNGMDINAGTGRIQLWSGNWRNTNAVSTITLTSLNAASFVQYSSFALYGIKG